MADDIDDIEDLLEAPYKNAQNHSQDAIKNGNGVNHDHPTNGDSKHYKKRRKQRRK